MRIARTLATPTPRMVNGYYETFRDDERYFRADSALAQLFRSFPDNTRLEDVLSKVSVLNDLYSTNIYASFQMARYTQRLKIDPYLKRGDAGM